MTAFSDIEGLKNIEFLESSTIIVCNEAIKIKRLYGYKLFSDDMFATLIIFIIWKLQIDLYIHFRLPWWLWPGIETILEYTHMD